MTKRNHSGTRSVIQRLWGFCNILKDDGVSYSDYVEQLTFLLFLKLDSEHALSMGRESLLPMACRWERLARKRGIELEAQYLNVLQTLSRQPRIVGKIFQRAQNKIQDAAKLERLVKLIDAEDWSVMDVDVKGAIYEGLLEKNAEDVKSGAGQYFTPRPLVRAMVEVVRPGPTDVVCDPACGTGGFFLAVLHYWRQRGSFHGALKRHVTESMFYGHEIVPSTARLGLMNLVLHGLGSSNRIPITVGDALIKKPQREFDIVVTNPPFGRKSAMVFTHEDVKVSADRLLYLRDDFVARTSNKQINFVQHVASILAAGGRAAIVVPDNVLFEAGAGEAVRRMLLQEFDLHTLLRLPQGIFYAPSVKANVLFFERPLRRSKNPATRAMWVYDLRTGNSFNMRSRPFTMMTLSDFVTQYRPDNRSARIETERFRRFTLDRLLERERCDFDVTWRTGDARDVESATELAVAILDDLEGATVAFRSILESLEGLDQTGVS